MLKERLKAINDDDFMTIFGQRKTEIVIAGICKSCVNQSKFKVIKDMLDAYDEYVPTITVGDIIELPSDAGRYIVTCYYTDETFDLISATGKIERHNIGCYLLDVKVVGKLEFYIS